MIDAEMTLHYTAGNWDSVIYYGNAGLDDSIDYFYLRKHLGEAYYYKLNYSSAIPHFEKALETNSADISLQVYLYNCYLYSGRETDTRYIRLKMSETALSMVKKIKVRGIDDIYFEAGKSFNNNFSKNQNTNFSSVPNLFGSAEMTGNMTYGHLGMKVLSGQRFSFYLGAGIMSEQRQSIFDVSNIKPSGRIITQRDTIVTKPMPPPPYQTHDTIISHLQAFQNNPFRNIVSHTFHQNEFYINCNIHAGNGFDIQPFIHILNTGLTQNIPINHEHDFTAFDTIATHTQYHFPPPSSVIRDTVFYNYNTHLVKLVNYSFIQKDTSFVNYSLGLTLNKSIGHCAASVFGSLSNLNGQNQQELGVSLTWFPHGNLNLYFNVAFTGYKEDSIEKLIKYITVGGKITKNIWIEGNFTMGDINNFTEKGGFVVNNNPDLIKYRAGANLIFVLKRFDITLIYQYQAKQEYYFFRDSSDRMIAGTLNYTNQLISGGIKWKI